MSGHGGARRGAGRPTKEQQSLKEIFKRRQQQQQTENRQKQLRIRREQERERNANIAEKKARERRMAFETLHRIAQEQALFDETNIHDHDQNIEYDEYSDDEEYDANDINNRKDENKYSKIFSTQENKARKNKSFHPPPNTVLYCAVKKTQEEVTKKRLKIDRFIIPPHNYVV